MSNSVVLAMAVQGIDTTMKGKRDLAGLGMMIRKRRQLLSHLPARTAWVFYGWAALIDEVFDKDFDKEFLAGLWSRLTPSRADWS
jgi:hypothetical protein